MTVIHGLAAFSKGGLAGVQASQRDWSPFLVHLTWSEAMEPFRRTITDGTAAEAVAAGLADADARSYEVFSVIAESGRLRACESDRRKDAPACVCLSECSLPGVIGLSERYGRFGFVFRKSAAYRRGARPCAYLDWPAYKIVSELRTAPPSSEERRLFGLCNVLTPRGEGRIQDFTHEREWRVFADLSFEICPPEMLLSPNAYLPQVRELFPSTTIIPIDTLFDWGA